MSTNPSPETGSLKFAVLCNGTDFQRWQATAIERLLEKGHQPVLLITDARVPERVSLASKLFGKKRKTLLFTFLENRIFRPEARSIVNLEVILAGVPVLPCRVTKRGFSEYFADHDVAMIKAAGADFILRFGFGILRGQILEAARYGIWSFHHDDEERYRGGPAGFWEIYFGDPVNGAILQRLTDRLDAGIILRKGFLKTVSHSYRENIQNLLTVPAEWPAAVAGFLVKNPDYTFNESTTAAPVYTLPGNFRMLVFLVKLAVNRIRFTWNDLFRAEQWNVAIIRKPIAQCLLNEWPVDSGVVTWFPPLPGDRYLADPGGFFHENQLIVLAEDFDYRRNRAAIGMWKINNEDSLWPERIADPAFFDNHVSYPYIVEHDGEVYMLPESWQSERISLYRFDAAMGEFQFHRHLIAGVRAVDPTLIYHGNRWWLFYTTREYSNTHLFLWWTDSLEQPFKPHAGNPVKTDIRSARPAGTPFITNGVLYRPAQDCSRTYGGRVALNRVDILTPERYSEVVVKTIEPLAGSRFSNGLHTVSRVGELTLIDSKRFIFSLHNMGSRLGERFQDKGKHHV